MLIPLQEGLLTKEQVAEELNWSNVSANINLNVSETNQPITNMVYKFVDAYGYIAFEIGKLGAIWGVDNIKISGKTLAIILVLYLLAPVLLNLIKLLLIIGIFIKEIIQSRKEKKELKILRRNKNV